MRTVFFRPGFVFKSGKLLEFQRYSLTVMKPWPAPLAWRRTTRKPFRPVRPKITLIPSPRDEQIAEGPITLRARDTLWMFMAPVPFDARLAVGMFGSRQWHMMALLARCPGALDLVRSTPALAFALASSWVFHDPAPTQPMRTARRLVRLPQAEICGWLGFPERPSTVRILRKLRRDAISIKTLLFLRDGLWDDEICDLLRHCRTIDEPIVALATMPRWRGRFSPRFFAELSAGDLSRSDEGALQMVRLGRCWRHLRPNQVFHSLNQLGQFLEERHRAAGAENIAKCPPDLQFPSPPLPGTDVIVPLTRGRDLLDEAAELKHCVSDYHGSVSGGGLYIYRVRAPERATLALRREEGTWRLHELKGYRNAPVRPATYADIYAWMSKTLREIPDGTDQNQTFPFAAE